MTIKLNSPFLLLWLLLPAILFGQNKANPEYLRNLNIRNIGPGAMSGRITALAVDPISPTTIYAGAASGGVWRSKSGGTNWEPIFDSAPVQSIGAIAINPNVAQALGIKVPDEAAIRRALLSDRESR